MENAKAIVERFVEAIKAHDVEALTRLMAEDHVFIDSGGRRVAGREQMKVAWTGYFAMCPDYWVRVEEWYGGAGSMVMLGAAGGTIDGERWEIPAAWRAEVEGTEVREWRVYADNKPVYEILARR